MKHRFRRALAAAAVLASALVVGSAAPAQATTYTNTTKVNASHVGALYSSITPGLSNWETVVSFDPGAAAFEGYIDHLTGSVQASGGSATLYLDNYNWGDNDSECTPSNGFPTNYRIEIRTSSGAQVGSTDWTPSFKTNCLTEIGGSDSKTVYFDNDPLDGDNSDGALTPGSYSIYVKVEDSVGSSDLEGIDTLGAHGNGPNNYSEGTVKGTFTVSARKVMLGLSENRTSDTYAGGAASTRKGVLDNDVADINSVNGATPDKSYAVSRLYDSGFNVPDTTKLDDFTDAGKLVLWSNKPPAAGSAGIGTNCATGGHVGTGTSTCRPWASIGQGNQDTTIDSILTTLYGLADGVSGHASQIVYVAVEHEPHDSATGTGGKCTGSCVGSSSDHGNAADYKAAWDKVYARRAYLESNGYPGITSRVLLAYCAVFSNADDKDGSGIIGSGDALYPGSTDVDLLAHDVYNWYYYVSGGNGYTWDTTPTWRNPSDSAIFGTSTSSTGSGLIALANTQGKKLIIAELGGHPGCDGIATDNGCTGTETSPFKDRDQWFRDLDTHLRTYDTNNKVIGFVWYHQKPDHVCSQSNPCSGNPKWNWQFANTDNRTPSSSGKPHGITGWNDAFITGTYASDYYGVPFTIAP